MVIWGLLHGSLTYDFGVCEYKILWVGRRSPESPILDWGQPLSAEMLITVEHAPIDVINQVNEAQCQ